MPVFWFRKPLRCGYRVQHGRPLLVALGVSLFHLLVVGPMQGLGPGVTGGSPSLSESEFAPGVLTIFAFFLSFGSILTFRVGGIPSSLVSVDSSVVLGCFLFLVILVVTLLFDAE